MSEWSDFYVAAAGAAAALTGLLFVGISINLSKILEYPPLPARASISITMLMAVLLVSMLMLMPHETATLLGWLVLLTGIVVWGIVAKADIRIHRQTDKQYKRLFFRVLLLDQLAVLPYPIGGLCLLLSGEVGLYWVAAAFVFSFIKAVLDAWVLLIEILR